MNGARVIRDLLVWLLVLPGMAAAQQLQPPSDSVRAAIHTTLRALYFNLDHRDWQALTADILAAKVLADRVVPEALLSVATRSIYSAGSSRECSGRSGPLINEAAIMLEGVWAGVTVQRCARGFVGVDRFRLIHFQERWRIVKIDLFQDPMNFTSGR